MNHKDIYKNFQVSVTQSSHNQNNLQEKKLYIKDNTMEDILKRMLLNSKYTYHEKKKRILMIIISMYIYIRQIALLLP